MNLLAAAVCIALEVVFLSADGGMRPAPLCSNTRILSLPSRVLKLPLSF